VLESHQPLRLCKPPPELLGQRDGMTACNSRVLTFYSLPGMCSSYSASGAPESWLRCLMVCVTLLFHIPCQADTWASPKTFETHSENKKFIARVVPAQKSSKARLIVSAVNAGRRSEVWRTVLGNEVSPVSVFISNDGASVVTLDNWAGVGYGDDIVAIYSRQGRLRAYSLEQIAPIPEPKADASGWLSSPRGYGRGFSHSAGSRHWRENGIEFFYNESGQLLFCLWLDWDDRWVLWRMSDGDMVPVTADLARRLNALGRTRALKAAKAKDFDPAALNFLGRQRIVEDRPLIEVWLQDKEFSTGSQTRYSSESPREFFAFTASSFRRGTADQILARWDGIATEKPSFRSREDYKFLGNLKGSITLPAAPAKGEGIIHLYLIPESTPLSEWASMRPEHYLSADLAYSYPHVFGTGMLRDGKLSNVVNFIIYGVTPGKYRLKAVWDRAKPFSKTDRIPCRPQAGDFESTTSPVVTVRKGAETEDVSIECKQPVAK
jgi:hypothetical protein